MNPYNQYQNQYRMNLFPPRPPISYQQWASIRFYQQRMNYYYFQQWCATRNQFLQGRGNVPDHYQASWTQMSYYGSPRPVFPQQYYQPQPVPECDLNERGDEDLLQEEPFETGNKAEEVSMVDITEMKDSAEACSFANDNEDGIQSVNAEETGGPSFLPASGEPVPTNQYDFQKNTSQVPPVRLMSIDLSDFSASKNGLEKSESRDNGGEGVIEQERKNYPGTDSFEFAVEAQKFTYMCARNYHRIVTLENKYHDIKRKHELLTQMYNDLDH